MLQAVFAALRRQWARLPRWLVGLVAGAVLSTVVLVPIAAVVASPPLPDISRLTDYQPNLPLRIYSSDNVLVGEYGAERRSVVPLEKIPLVMQNAVLAAEDARFRAHGGIDYKGMLRAALANLGEVRSQGASTITMQVAKNFFFSNERTFIRKLMEVQLAYKIEQELSKDKILELYMNQVFLGQRAYGFAAASEIYFGKPLADIDIAQAAMLAGLLKGPTVYNPIANPRNAATRQRYVLYRMLQNSFITQQQYDDALKQPLTYRTASDVPLHAEYAAEMARQAVFNQYGPEAYTRGITVRLTINSAEQEVAYRALRKGIMDYERRQVYRGPEGFVVLPNDADAVDEAVAEALTQYPDNGEIKSAVVLEALPAKITAMLRNGDTITATGEGLRPVQSGLSPKAAVQVKIVNGSVVRVLKDAKDRWTVTQLPEVEGAQVALDPNTGAVRTLVGGFDHSKNKFNHVTQAWRQPGSSIKPFIYSAALEKGFMPGTIVDDAPISFPPGPNGAEGWAPRNADGSFDGPIPLHAGLARSKNIVAIKTLQAIGAPYAQTWLTRFGFEADKHPPYLTMALGAGSTTPLQLASAYTVLANGGYRLDPYLISKITDSKDNTLYEAHPAGLDSAARVIDERNAFLMTSMLREVTRPGGSAARAQGTLKRPDISGKTGTTSEAVDAWFAGYQKNLVSVVWMGYDTPQKLGDRESGGGLSLPIWLDYMAYALKGLPIAEPLVPTGVVSTESGWAFEEFANVGNFNSYNTEQPRPEPDTPNAGTAPAVGMEPERRSIFDLFRR